MLAGEPDDSAVGVFLATFDDYVTKGQSDEALNFILEPDNEKLVILSCIELVTCIGHRMSNGELFRRDVETWCTLQNILDYVVKISKPKEILLSLLELVGQIGSDEFFDLLIKPLKVTFLRLPNKRLNSLLYAFNKLYKYIRAIDPDDVDESLYQRYVETAEDQLLLDHWRPSLRGGGGHSRVDSCVDSSLNLLEPFVSEAHQCKLIDSNEQRHAHVLALSSALLSLLDQPVAHFDVGKRARKLHSDRVNTVHRLISMLFDLTPNAYWKIIGWQQANKLSIADSVYDNGGGGGGTESEMDADDAHVRLSAVGVLSAFVHYYGVCLDRLPCVYSIGYVTGQLTAQIPALLCDGSKQQPDHVRLGLKLCKWIVRRTDEGCWSPNTLDTPFDRFQLVFGLIRATAVGHSQRLRQKSFEMFTRVIKLFDDRARLALVRMVFRFMTVDEQPDDDDETESSPDDSSSRRTAVDHREFIVPQCVFTHIRGHVIDFYRECLRLEMTSSPIDSRRSDSSSSSIDIYRSLPFLHDLPSMLAVFANMPDGEATDLLENFEQITATLNLIRFVCLFQSGRFNFEQLFGNVERRFLPQLLRAIDLTKAHYELELRNARRDRQGRQQRASLKPAPFGGGGGQTEQQVNVLKQSLCKLDLIHSLVGRVGDLLRGVLVPGSSN